MKAPLSSRLTLAIGLAVFSASTARMAAQPVLAYDTENTTIDYKREGKPGVKVRLSEPVVVATASKPETWGYFQFPRITRQNDGNLIVRWAMKTDSVVMYGKPGSAFSISTDNGKTWTPWRREPAVVRETPATADLVLPNGDRLEIGTPEAFKANPLKLPEPVGALIDDYTKAKRYLYRVSELPPALQGAYLRRLPKGETTWRHEHVTVEDPEMLRYSLFGLLPVVWWGDMRLASDGSIISGIYPNYATPAGVKGGFSRSVFFYRSTDDGHSWKIQGRIHYQPDPKADPSAMKRAGYSEPALEILPDGTLLVVLRTAGGTGNGPLYLARSSDQGVSWSKPEAIANSGVMPRLLRLSNGILVLSSGRPGAQLRFSPDGQGRHWTDAFELLPYKNETDQVSCGITGLFAIGPNHFLIVYSDLKHPDGKDLRKAIKVREVIVTAQ